MDHSYHVVFACGCKAVDLVTGIGEYIPLMKGICTVAVLESDLAFEHQNELRILVIVDRIFLYIRDRDVDGKIILIGYFFKKHMIITSLTFN
jgi:hypothetical protein